MNPAVSLLIPTYSYARFLPTALESVLAQNFAEDFEIIVSDDASPDGSADVIRRYAQRATHLRPFFQEVNLGMVANWNFCLQQARGEFIQFLFADDCFATPDALSTLVQRLRANPRAALATAPRLEIDSAGEIHRLRDDWREPANASGAAAIARCLKMNRNLIGEPSAVMFRRNLGLRGFDPGYRQVVDLEMWFHLLQQGEFEYVRQPLVAFRHHEAQQTALNRKNNIDRLEAITLAQTYLPSVTSSQNPHFISRWQSRQILFRALYGARKVHGKNADRLKATATLRAQLRFPWIQLCWTAHCFARPLKNLAENLRKRHEENLGYNAREAAAFLRTIASRTDNSA